MTQATLKAANPEKSKPEKSKQCNPRCAVTSTVEIIGGKWKAVVLFHLMDEPRRFSDLQRRLSGVTQRMLTLQLRELEADGLVHREVYPQVPPKVEYSLTDLGRTIEPIIRAMLSWGKMYQAQALGEKK
jgi:DNA-binding HxlR family transcriptional regulator